MSKWLLLVVYITLSTSWVFAGKNIYGEKRVDLSGYWQFKTDPEAVGKSLNWQTALFDDSQWDKMAVPGSWELTNPYSNYIGQSWYRTTFNTPTHLSGQIIFLEFEAVSMSYQVYVNGQFVAEEAVGNYIERFDITSFLNESGKNTLAVMVDNSVVYGAYCNWGGFVVR